METIKIVVWMFLLIIVWYSAATIAILVATSSSTGTRRCEPNGATIRPAASGAVTVARPPSLRPPDQSSVAVRSASQSQP